MWRDLLWITVALCVHTQTAEAENRKVSCKDEQGKDVDWYYMYKLPKHYKADGLDSTRVNAANEKDDSGLHYLYVTSDSYNDWQRSTTKVSERNSLPGLTLQPLYDEQTVLLIAYNDEFPNGTVVATGGHSKGVVATDGVTGIWLVHSVPKFPSMPHYEYPPSGAHYAQSFLCLTLGVDEMDKVGEMLLYNEPNIYYERMPFALGERFPTLERVTKRQWRTIAPFSKTIDLFTLGGKHFKSFGKGGRAHQELYAEFVAPTLDVNLLVETWRNGAGNLEPSCQISDKVYNIASIEEKDLKIAFPTSNDHSKWAVSEQSGLKIFRWRIGGADWTCVGDINRQQHQLVRGGGTVCQKSARVANLYRKLIASHDTCA